MTTSEPTTGEIVRALRCAQKVHAESAVYGLAADRLESQERDLETLRAFHERYAEQTSKQYVVAVCGLTARAEQAEKERDDIQKNLARRIMKHLSENLLDSTFVCEICEYNLTNSPKCRSCGTDFQYGENFELKHTLRGQPQDGEGL